MLLYGDGVPMDQAEGLRWLEKAAAQDQVDALRALGTYALNGDFGGARDVPRAIALLERAAARNDGHAMALLGHIHLNGCGGERRLETAAVWYERAARQGFPVPQAMSDPSVLAKIKPAGCDPKVEQRSRVRRAQAALKSLGYYRGAVDGIDGKGTRAAVNGFQKDQGLTVDGKIDVVLMRHLRARIFNDPLNDRLETASR
jgi:TPR repeat protein